MAQFTLLIETLEHGSARVTISDSVQHLILFPSYISDAFTKLADAVLSMVRSLTLDTVSCSWQEEPGEDRWLVRRTEAGVWIEIRHFAECYSRLPDERGERIFSTQCSLLRLATQVKGQLHRLLNEYG